ncbi:hypothetical protein FGO68_gene4791 [Halteria grandinella]|uniref:Uncharacterized protein n=1 Tax=Halteria grandinella TaxID=5974 RepID=A0A8J8NF57_HALGN|nr:hypothetical protein FGO68_gene4791 [Halteria grandinella]
MRMVASINFYLGIRVKMIVFQKQNPPRTINGTLQFQFTNQISMIQKWNYVNSQQIKQLKIRLIQIKKHNQDVQHQF